MALKIPLAMLLGTLLGLSLHAVPAVPVAPVVRYNAMLDTALAPIPYFPCTQLTAHVPVVAADTIKVLWIPSKSLNCIVFAERKLYTPAFINQY